MLLTLRVNTSQENASYPLYLDNIGKKKTIEGRNTIVVISFVILILLHH